MFRPRIMSAAVLLILLISGCEQNRPGVSPEDLTNIRLPFGVSQYIEEHDLNVTFYTFDFDSRCPSDSLCKWTGFAGISILVQQSRGGRVLLYVLGNHDEPCPTPFVSELNDLRWELVDLLPHPGGKSIPDSEYVAVIRVHEVDPASPDPQEVIMCDLPRDEIEINGVISMDSVRLEHNRIRFTATVGGGCGPHKFYLYATPSPQTAFSPEVDLYLRYFAAREPCEGESSVDLSFKLPSLCEFMADFSDSPTPIKLNLHHPLDPATYEFVYYPPDTTQADMMPMAVGNYWVYADTIRTSDSVIASRDSIAVIGTHIDAAGSWWVLNRPLFELGDTIMVRNDTIFSRHYTEMSDPWPSPAYIPAQCQSPYEYSIVMDNSVAARQVRRIDWSVDFPIGPIWGVYLYSEGVDWFRPYNRILAPAIGFIAGLEHPAFSFPDTSSHRKTMLVDYHLEPVEE